MGIPRSWRPTLGCTEKRPYEHRRVCLVWYTWFAALRSLRGESAASNAKWTTSDGAGWKPAAIERVAGETGAVTRGLCGATDAEWDAFRARQAEPMEAYRRLHRNCAAQSRSLFDGYRTIDRVAPIRLFRSARAGEWRSTGPPSTIDSTRHQPIRNRGTDCYRWSTSDGMAGCESILRFAMFPSALQQRLEYLQAHAAPRVVQAFQATPDPHVRHNCSDWPISTPRVVSILSLDRDAVVRSNRSSMPGKSFVACQNGYGAVDDFIAVAPGHPIIKRALERVLTAAFK